MSESEPLLLTVAQAAQMLQMGRNTIYEMVARDEMPCVRIGRTIRISRAGLMAWISAKSGEAPQGLTPVVPLRPLQHH